LKAILPTHCVLHCVSGRMQGSIGTNGGEANQRLHVNVMRSFITHSLNESTSSQ